MGTSKVVRRKAEGLMEGARRRVKGTRVKGKREQQPESQQAEAQPPPAKA